MKASDCGWKYKSGERVQIGDHVLISKHWAKHHDVKREAVVTGLQGFVAVALSNGSDSFINIDLDMRSLTFGWIFATFDKAMREYPRASAN